MAKIYYRRIKARIMTIDEVPARWHEQVHKMMDKGKEESNESEERE